MMAEKKGIHLGDQTANGSLRAASGLVMRQIWIGVDVG